MTIVHFGLRHPGAAGRVQATGRVAWIPTERKVDGSLVVLPSRVSVTLTPEASAEIEPGTYLFHEEAVGGISAYRIVPNAIEVEYASLVAVDPATLDPEAQPEAAWYAFVESLNASNADMLASALSAQHSAELAQLSATGSQTSAAASAQLSAGSALASSNSATASANSATQAGTARDGAVSAQASAAGHASAASGYRDVAAEYADEAAEQAGLALVRAGTATDAAAEATAAVLGFGIGTVSTVGPSEAAAATVTGPVGNRVLNLTLPRGATPVFSVLETTTGPETPGATGLKGEKGDKGDPGGLIGATELGTTHLDTVITAGLYRQTNGSNATTANGYPQTINSSSVMLVFAALTSNITQEFRPILGGHGDRVFWRRFSSNSGVAWSPWRAFTNSRMDNTVGRALYNWDETNGREQIIWGDTGRRNISAQANGTFTGGGKLTIRREGSLVDIYCVGWMPGAAGTVHLLASGLPTGFKPSNSRNWFAAQNSVPALCTMAFDGTTIAVISNAADTHPISFSFSYSTTDPWPTVLPGSADGAIPPV
ncbi:hypothetical protein SEA_HUNTINGDON_1 [Arthrobacter phage Huntingdon]|uniref:Minor tail protein n=1 Tax=Arthrobacter phage Huntingdon TaxID=2047760 RepID=A0A2H4PAE7_9CAUD|nr:minor tail protein [Arthrobacter phage Huntingdon]AOQ28213.1 hypothetical protein SEA_RCIGASTRUGA_1 [Arthrobacter phage RcigaStruga]ATW59208.1 hypothetical protein SEA_HUNTINGDON_1 [Arthrobacter phage Huntingdon]